MPSTNRSCLVTPRQLCGGELACAGVTPCELAVCATTHYTCDDGVTCRRRSTLCDGDSCNDCGSNSAAEWQNGAGFKCVRNGRVCVLPQSLLGDAVQDCDNGDDFCYETDE